MADGRIAESRPSALVASDPWPRGEELDDLFLAIRPLLKTTDRRYCCRFWPIVFLTNEHQLKRTDEISKRWNRVTDAGMSSRRLWMGHVNDLIHSALHLIAARLSSEHLAC